MGSKYHIKADDLKFLFKTIDMTCRDRYHEIYEKIGARKGQGNFHCFNEGAHIRGDTHPSLSIDNSSGKFNCFGCGIKGNLNTYVKEYLNEPSYTDFMIDLLNMQSQFGFRKGMDDVQYNKTIEDMKKLSEDLTAAWEKKNGKPYMVSEVHMEAAKEEKAIEMRHIDECVEDLLKDYEKMEYLGMNYGGINETFVRKYKIGLLGEHYVFPQFDEAGNLVNLKGYNPFASDKAYKWKYFYKGRITKPVPFESLAGNVITFFEGEPDMYTALSLGVPGAFTLGACSNLNLDEIFGGTEGVKRLFGGKEIYICMDTDDPGIRAAKKLAHSLYSYAKQIKIINLNKSESNPIGLDPDLKNDNGKRKEKDFRDFAKKIGMNDNFKVLWNEFTTQFTAYDENPDRLRTRRFKVSLQEGRKAIYYSPTGDIEIETIASVSDFDYSAFMYPEKIRVTCPFMKDEDKDSASCKTCSLPEMKSFHGPEQDITLKVDEANPDENHLRVDPHDILGLIQCGDEQKAKKLARMIDMNANCKRYKITEFERKKILKVRLVRDVSEQQLIDSGDAGSANIDVEGYLVSEGDVYSNKSYRFIAIQTTSSESQHAVFYIRHCEPIESNVGSFVMDEGIHETLRIFQPKPGESLDDHFKRRYGILSNAAGMTGRDDLFMMLDMAFFSQKEIHSRLIPEVTRGWVEVLIGGQSRCGKSVVAHFLRNHYKMGEIISGSTAVSRTGLLGGVRMLKGKSNICWGKIPMNDGGLVIIDEMSNMSYGILDDMTPCRSDGYVDIEKAASGKAWARCRKIFLSNARASQSEYEASNEKGMPFLRALCMKDEILSRFDTAMIVRQDDVPADQMKSLYTPISNEFTSLQFQKLIMWVYSRKAEDIMFDEGVEDYIHLQQSEMLKVFHSDTQLVNLEMRAKIVRMAVAVADMTYSHAEGDWNKVFITKTHVDFVVKFLTKIYCGKNMMLDAWSETRRKGSILGDMRFMQNLAKYTDISSLANDSEFTRDDFLTIFFDPLQMIATGRLSLIDAKSDDRLSHGFQAFQGVNKLIGIMKVRNCIIKGKGNGKWIKTSMFSDWIKEYVEFGEDAPTSDILENGHAELDNKIRRELEGVHKAFERYTTRKTA